MPKKKEIYKDSSEEYEASDSEKEYSEGEKELIEEVRKGRRRDVDAKKQLMEFTDSDDEADDSNDMADSDIEGKEVDDEDLPDTREWGRKKSNYYNTDFVDPDYSSYTAQEEELAKLEEEEALSIQARLLKQMKEEDFFVSNELFDDETNLPRSEQSMLKDLTKVRSHFTDMPEPERLRLFQQDSPEFPGLLADFKLYLEEVRLLLSPVMRYVMENKVPMIPALEFAELYQNISLTYCTHLSFYLLLKAQRISVRAHPITKRLLQLKQLLTQLKDKYENIIKPQLEALLERIEDGDEFEVLDTIPAKGATKKQTLSIIDKYNIDDVQRNKLKDKATLKDLIDDEDASSSTEEDDEHDTNEENTRRGITYQIAKNKGLMPHRKKELRNPRVKHRGKFRKALIRRKGSVRTVRKETKRYGGEISGIKAGVSKSIKF